MQTAQDLTFEQIPHESAIEAIMRSDSAYNGKFYTGVITTGIYCLPSCTARKPKVENIVIFKTKDHAEHHGLRPCKKCIPDLPVTDWGDEERPLSLRVPPDFNFEACILFFRRSPIEPLHHVKDGRLHKLILIGRESIIIEVSAGPGETIEVRFLNMKPTKGIRIATARYLINWLDLNRDLTPFYAMAEQNAVLRETVAYYHGLRIIGIPDLFEALTWAITGQQINLPFAYTLKRRFIERYGTHLVHNGHTYWSYPSPDALMGLPDDALVELGFTRMKSEFIVGVARRMADGRLDPNRLLECEEYDTAYKELTAIRGVGDWTANYVLMRFLHAPSALPANDVALQNAIQTILALPEKPTADDVRHLAKQWQGWEAYSTFYLWMTLLQNDATGHITNRRSERSRSFAPIRA